ncbi:MAG: hypothetical protein JW864_18545 [Spirochaetes bacterium]|nr:hypothetical protein [Spirochaetota bacterium]
MSNYVSIIFCKNCNSRYVEIEEWAEPEKKVIIRCRTCGVSEIVTNFTLGRCKISDKDLQTARDTRAIPFKFER